MSYIMDAQVDASRPFRSVKEAIAIFGDQLFLGETQSSQKRPSFGVENETSYTSDLTPSLNKTTNPSGEQDVGSTFDEPSDSLEITLGPTGPLSIASKQVVKPPTYEVTPSPFNEQGAGSSSDEPSYKSEITLVPIGPLSIASKQVIESPMYESTPSAENTKKNHGNIVHGNDLVMMLMVLKKLEVELQETKTELKLLKERGSETEVALASLNEKLHKNMSKIAKAEAAEAAKEATKSITSTNEGRYREMEMRDEERTRRELMVKTIDSPTLAQILKISDYDRYFEENKLRTRKLMKKKPIVPLVTDLFPWKKKASPNPGVSDQIFSKMYFT